MLFKKKKKTLRKPMEGRIYIFYHVTTAFQIMGCNSSLVNFYLKNLKQITSNNKVWICAFFLFIHLQNKVTLGILTWHQYLKHICGQSSSEFSVFCFYSLFLFVLLTLQYQSYITVLFNICLLYCWQKIWPFLWSAESNLLATLYPVFRNTEVIPIIPAKHHGP